jgi:hypothetical protein
METAAYADQVTRQQRWTGNHPGDEITKEPEWPFNWIATREGVFLARNPNLEFLLNRLESAHDYTIETDDETSDT